MELYPPGPSIYKDPSAFDVRGKYAFESTQSNKQSQVQDNQPKALYTRGSHKKLNRRPKVRPPKIVYPEDRLRERFYKDHPFELNQPISLVERNIATKQKYESISDYSPFGISGESVIRRQLFLMHGADGSEGLTEDQAYTIACSEFYQARAEKELETRIAGQEAKQHGHFSRVVGKDSDKNVSNINRIHSLLSKTLEWEKLLESEQVIAKRNEMSSTNSSLLGF
ncbi:37S ribosomal protein S25, mitochondrial [Zancudomyces culisetae]|uniref:Small ribosomal subunit protein mS23 n=1 Tax=Zancudomyces culisetae TaxID=1213189 RepID=A0A1R1PVF1_ZANCU|nr:37S ribosomal protein S25, mitochondrial [Zancudomyces culisetae]|eukprot:OMH84957.1 37S ribosomal protein S25, mitochondrial [Zancudomyces culisetae]